MAKTSTCPACKAAQGAMHEFGCALEVCPFCFGSLACCQCAKHELDLEIGEELSDDDDQAWLLRLSEQGRIPSGPLLGTRTWNAPGASPREQLLAAAHAIALNPSPPPIRIEELGEFQLFFSPAHERIDSYIGEHSVQAAAWTLTFVPQRGLRRERIAQQPPSAIDASLAILHAAVFEALSAIFRQGKASAELVGIGQFRYGYNYVEDEREYFLSLVLFADFEELLQALLSHANSAATAALEHEEEELESEPSATRADEIPKFYKRFLAHELPRLLSKRRNARPLAGELIKDDFGLIRVNDSFRDLIASIEDEDERLPLKKYFAIGQESGYPNYFCIDAGERNKGVFYFDHEEGYCMPHSDSLKAFVLSLFEKDDDLQTEEEHEESEE